MRGRNTAGGEWFYAEGVRAKLGLLVKRAEEMAEKLGCKYLPKYSQHSDNTCRGG